VTSNKTTDWLRDKAKLINNMLKLN